MRSLFLISKGRSPLTTFLRAAGDRTFWYRKVDRPLRLFYGRRAIALLASKGRSQFLITILPLLKSLEDRAQHGVASQSQYIHPFLHKKLDAYQIP